MREMTAQDLFRDLFPSECLPRSAKMRQRIDMIRDALASNPPHVRLEVARRVDALTRLVLDLLAEVEALRRAQNGESRYRDAYRETCLLTHDSSGPSGGWEKLLESYYPDERCADGRVRRESIMMFRLGFTPGEVGRFHKEAEEAELFT